jgi:transposase-like protein
LYNKNNQQEEERSEVVMGIKRRQYSKEQKEEMVQKALSGKSILALGKENNISPGLINRWKRQYLNGELNGNNNNQFYRRCV